MKAKDLAALAALGIAGKYAYDKFGNKTEPAAKRQMGEGLDMTNQGAYERATRPESSQMDETDYNAPRTAPRTVPEDYDAPRTAPRQPVAVASPVPTRSVKPVSTSSVATTPDVVADDYQMPRTAPKPVMPDAKRVTPYNSDIMYSDTVPFDTSMPHNDKMNQAAYSRNKRAGVVPSQMPNDAAQARIARQSMQPSEAAAIAKEAEKQRLRQARTTFDPAGRSADRLNQSTMKTLNRQMRGYAKGGAVKMASGGLASSKMSKPSGASRGDGIAQRGRTRGTLR
jgi:hypothetical protein